MARGNPGALDPLRGLESPFSTEAFEEREDRAPMGADLFTPFESAFETPFSETQPVAESETDEGLRTLLRDLVLLPHTVTFTSVEAPVKPVNIDPAIYDGPVKFRIAPRLQACLNAAMKDPRLKDLSVALVDLTDGVPQFAGFNHKRQIPAEAPAKLAAVLAAFQLRHDLRMLLKSDADATTNLGRLFGDIRRTWAAAQMVSAPDASFAGPITRRGNLVLVNGRPVPLAEPKAPQLETIFRSVAAGDPTTVEFSTSGETAEQWRKLVSAAFAGSDADRAAASKKVRDLGFAQRLAIMMGASTRIGSDLVAQTVVRDLGFEYIASVLLQYGLFDPNRGGGLWLGSDYDRNDWQSAPASSLTKAEGGAHSATAGALAAFLTLLARGELVDRESSAEMSALLKQEMSANRDLFGFREEIEELPNDASELPAVNSIGGIRGGAADDCGLIERVTPSGERLRYVAVGLGAARGAERPLKELVKALDGCVAANRASPGSSPQHENQEGDEQESPFASAFPAPETEEETGHFGKGARKRITATERIPFRWICSIAASKIVTRPSHTENRGLAPAGTGLLISPRHVLTAAHILKGVDDDDGLPYEADVVKVTPARDEDRAPFGVFEAKSWVLHPKYDPAKKDPKTDYAVITLEKPAGDQKFASLKGEALKFWPIEALSGPAAAAIAGGDVLTAGYPNARALNSQMWCFTGPASTGSPRLDASIKQSGEAAQRVRKLGVLFLWADAERGQSGSPVWTVADDKPLVLGVLVEAGDDANRAALVNDDMLNRIGKWTGQGAAAHELEEPESEVEVPFIGAGFTPQDGQEYEEPPPRGLVLLDHMHVPKTRDSSGAFKTGAIAIMTPSAMNPGFVDDHDEVITDRGASGLQTCLEKAITDRFSRLLARSTATKPSGGDRVHVAVADLTGAKLARPDFAGWGSTVAIYGASAPKILAVYAAFQLRTDLRKMAEDQAIPTGKELAEFAVKRWREKKVSRGLPDLKWLFDIQHWSAQPNDLKFTADVEAALAGINENDDASKLIRGVGFPYIASVAWQSGLRHGARGGLWLSNAYDGGDGWADNPSMKAPAAIHNITALSAVTYFTLLAQGRLVDDFVSAEITNILFKGCPTCLYPWRESMVAKKCGYVKPYMHDCFLLRRLGRTYAAAILTELEATWHGKYCPTDGETGLYTDLCKAVDELIENNNKHPKPACG